MKIEIDNYLEWVEVVKTAPISISEMLNQLEISIDEIISDDDSLPFTTFSYFDIGKKCVFELLKYDKNTAFYHFKTVSG